MKLSYIDMRSDKRRKITAWFTTESALSSYGQPVLVSKQGPIDTLAWYILGFEVEEATEEERAQLKRMGLIKDQNEQQ